MKIRQGFVSNSSSSSFCIFGAYMSGSKVMGPLCKYLIDNIEEVRKTKGNEDLTVEWLESEPASFEVNDVYQEFCGINIHESDGQYWIGRDYETMGDDETGKEFRGGVKKLLENIFGKEIKVAHHEFEIYN